MADNENIGGDKIMACVECDGTLTHPGAYFCEDCAPEFYNEINYHPQLGKLFNSTCPKCGNIDRITEGESRKIVHCQRCYYHYKFDEGGDGK